MSRKFHVNQTVYWSWGNGETQGKIREVYEQHRHKPGGDHQASGPTVAPEPAYLIEQYDGGRVLKNESELRDV